MPSNLPRRNFLRAGTMGAAALLFPQFKARAAMNSAPKALVFDTFGTIVDWRSSIVAEGNAWGKTRGLNIDWAHFADRWRSGYGPAMEKVRTGRAPLDQARCAASDDSRSIAPRVRHHRPDRGRKRPLESRLAPAEALARFGRRSHAPQEKVHHRAAVQRQRLAAYGHGEKRGPALGSDSFGRARAAL